MGRLWELVEDIEMKMAVTPASTTVTEHAVKVGAQSDPLCWTRTPRERLTHYLDTWAHMDEAAWSEANVKALYDDIMDVFSAHPEANIWFNEWRKAHPEGRIT